VTPTQRTLRECARRGWPADVVERRVWRVTKDLFNCLDVVAITPSGILGIQCTSDSGGNHAARVAKCLAEPRMRAWLAAGAFCEVWSWGKKGPRGKRKTWTLRVEAVQP
jgi:hypothetical protein